MKDIKRDLYSITLGMPQGWDFKALGVPRGSNKLQHGHVSYTIDGNVEQNKMKVKKCLWSNW